MQAPGGTDKTPGNWGLLASSLRSRKRSAHQMLQSARFVQRLEQLAGQLQQPLPAVQIRARAAAEALSTVDSPLFGAISSRLLAPLFTRAWTVQADQAALERLRQLNTTASLVFLPTHRSYADPFSLAQVLHDAGMARNHTLGGENLGFFPFGTITRRSGGVMIRRSFQDDPVYKFVVSEYLHFLTAQGANLEWYMEGGRSRTGKLRPPKYGLLRYVVDGFDGGRDLLLVPVSITYDQLHEVGMMAAEEAGGAKGKEGLHWMRDYIRRQRQWIGRVYLRFGEPLSMHEAIARASTDASTETTADAETGSAADPQGRRWLVERIAFTVFQRINQVTPVTAAALTTLALLGVRDRALTLGEVRDVIKPLLDYAAQRGLPFANLEFLQNDAGVSGVLAELARSGVVQRYAQGQEPVYGIQPGQHAVAAFYRNSAIHWFIDRALIELALLSVVDRPDDDPLTQAWNQTLAMRDLLKFDFFFSSRTRFRQEIADQALLIAPDYAQRMGSSAARLGLLEQAPFLIAHRILPAFLEAYYVVADRLATQPTEQVIQRERLIEECTRFGRQYLLQQRLHNPEAVSRELFGNALQLAANRKLLEPGERLSERRKALLEQIGNLLRALATIEEIDHRRNTAPRP